MPVIPTGMVLGNLALALPTVFREWVRPLSGIFGARSRRWSVTADRAHIELRTVRREESGELVRRIAEAFAAMTAVAWAEVNPFTNRLVIAFDPSVHGVEDLIATL